MRLDFVSHAEAPLSQSKRVGLTDFHEHFEDLSLLWRCKAEGK